MDMFGIRTPAFIYSYKLDASAHYEWVTLCMPHSGGGSVGGPQVYFAAVSSMICIVWVNSQGFHCFILEMSPNSSFACETSSSICPLPIFDSITVVSSFASMISSRLLYVASTTFRYPASSGISFLTSASTFRTKLERVSRPFGITSSPTIPVVCLMDCRHGARRRKLMVAQTIMDS